MHTYVIPVLAAKPMVEHNHAANISGALLRALQSRAFLPGVVDRLLSAGGHLSGDQDNGISSKFNGGYRWQPSEVSTFFPGRQASISITRQSGDKAGLDVQQIGHFGILHPKVLANFDITFPVSALEIDVEPFCFNQTYKSLPTHLYIG